MHWDYSNVEKLPVINEVPKYARPKEDVETCHRTSAYRKNLEIVT
jgi:hypothetical protein